MFASLRSASREKLPELSGSELSLAVGRSPSASLDVAPTGRYLSGLDGLRALAVMAVLAYHSSLGIVPAGFLGVEVFFVISGFIITLGLLREREGNGRIALREFWARRAKRLLPALFLLLASLLVYEELFERGEVASFRNDAIAALGYVTNWYLIAGEQSYFDTFARPPLLRHLWSLAIEEQFYVTWPLIVAVALSFLRPRRVMLLICAGAIASSLAMALLWTPGHDVSRVYYGTDTRASGLLVGAALAFLISNRLKAPRAPARLRLRWDVVAVLALAALTVMVLTLGETSGFFYEGGFALADLAAALLIAAVTYGRSRAVRLLDSPPVRWIGLRSYGIYLWHWPIFTLTRPGIDVPFHGLPLVAAQTAATFVIAGASYKWLEQPVRQGGLGRLWASLLAWRTMRRRWQGSVALSCLSVVVFSAVALAAAIRSEEPAKPEYFQLDSIRLVAHRAADTSASQSSATTYVIKVYGLVRDGEASSGDSEAKPALATVSQPATEAPAPPPPAPQAPPPKPASPPPAAAPILVTAIGDSVMLGAAARLVQEIPGIDVDAAVSRAMVTAIDLLRQRAGSGQLGPVVLLHVGNNGPITDSQVEQVFDVLGNDRKVVFVNLKVPRSWEAPNNDVIARGVARHANAVLVDWRSASEDKADVFWSDGMHLRPEGAAVYVDLVRPYMSVR